MGSADSVAPAIMGANSVSLANLKVFRPTWMVYMRSLLVTRKGQKKVFHEDMKVLMAMTASTVLDSGSTMRTKMPGWLQPSSLALSISGVGMLAKNCLARNTL